MPLNFSNLQSINYKKFIVKNETSGVLFIGDLKLKLVKGAEIDLFKPIADKIQRKKYTAEDISESRDLKLALKRGDISIYTEFGRIESFDDAIQSTNIATDYQVEKDVENNASSIEVKQYSFRVSTETDLGNKTSVALNLNAEDSLPSWISLVDNTKITFENSGIYDVIYSVPFAPYSGGVRSVWIAKNGEYPEIIDGGINKAIKKLSSDAAATNAFINSNYTNDRIVNALLGDFTVEFWYNPIAFGSNSSLTSSEEEGAIFCINGSNPQSDGVFQLSTGKLAFRRNGTTHLSFTEMNTLSLNTWHHIAVVWDVTGAAYSCRLYVNGVLESTKTSASGGAGTSIYRDLNTLINLSYGDHSFAIDDIRVSNNARYSNNFDPPTTLVVDANTLAAYNCQISSSIGQYSITTAIENTAAYRLEDLSSNNLDMNLNITDAQSGNASFQVISSFSLPSSGTRYGEASSYSNGATQPLVVSGSDALNINEEDYIEIYVYQDSGFTLTPNSSDPGRITVKIVQ